MIFANEGRTEMRGTVITLLTDLAGVINSLHRGLVEDYGEDNANWLITFAGKLGYTDDEERAKELADELLNKIGEMANEHTSVEYERS